MTVLEWRGFNVAAWVCALALAVATVVALVQLNWSGAVILAVALVAALAVTLWGRRAVDPLFVLLFNLALVVNAMGYAWHLFMTIPPYDELVHGFTIFTITLTFGIPIFKSLAPGFELHRVLFVVAVTSFGIAVGALWEVAEYLLDLAGVAIFNTYPDTILDLVMDSTGAFLAALLSLWVLGARESHAERLPATTARDTV
jgi:hypothetical protein